MKICGFSILFVALIFSCNTKSPEVDISKTATRGELVNWKFEAQREEISPAHFIDSETLFQNKPTLATTGDGKFYSNGHWFSKEDAEPGKFYQFKVYYSQKNVDEPNRCVLARIIWMDSEGKKIGWPEYPRIVRGEDNDEWNLIQQTYLAPEKVDQVRIELIFRWDADGIVNFGGMFFQEVPKPEPRPVNLATIYYRPRGGKTQMDNLNQFAPYIKEAAEKGADIVCMPEGSTSAWTGMKYIFASEPVPGPSTEFLGKLAKEHSMYIVAGILEREGPVVYNIAVLLDRNGDLIGKYRKTSLPREEIEAGITPGNELPVFDTDFGRIGMMICWDSSFPEQARTLAMKGAEVIFLPIWGGNLTLVKARAIENQVYLVSSTFEMISAVFSQDGEVLAEATENDPVVVVEVDLNEQNLWPWVGDFKNRMPREMPSKMAIETN